MSPSISSVTDFPSSYAGTTWPAGRQLPSVWHCRSCSWSCCSQADTVLGTLCPESDIYCVAVRFHLEIKLACLLRLAVQIRLISSIPEGVLSLPFHVSTSSLSLSISAESLLLPEHISICPSVHLSIHPSAHSACIY